MKKYLSAILALLLILGLAGCKEAQSTATVPTLLDPVGVHLDSAIVEKGDIYDIAFFEGQVVPYVQTLYFPTSVKLGEVSVQLGDTVEAGQILATADLTKTQSSIDKLEAEIAHEEKLAKFSDDKAQANIDIAKAELEILKRDGASAEEQNVKRIEIQQLQTSLKQTKQLREIEMSDMYAELDELKASLVDIDLVAPFSGTVVYINSGVETGDTVKEDKPMFVLADNSRTYVSAGGLRENLIKYAHRIYARVLDEDIDLRYLPENENPDLEEIYEATGEMMFAYEREEALETGLFAAVLLVDNYRENVLSIPVNAVYRDRTGDYVYKIVDGERVHCPVKVGTYTDTRVEIVEGLQEGDEVYVQN